MKGVKFGSLHSFNEWGLILSEKEKVNLQHKKGKRNE